jgi:hypothetical protein
MKLIKTITPIFTTPTMNYKLLKKKKKKGNMKIMKPIGTNSPEETWITM